MSKPKYQNKYSCNKCGEGKNEITNVTDRTNGLVLTCDTECTKCGFEDTWSAGSFQSNLSIEPKAKLYCN